MRAWSVRRIGSVSATPLFGFVAAIVVAGCGSSAYRSSGTTPAAVNSGPVSTAQTSLGRVLTDARGFTLYVLSADQPGKPACNGVCLQTWPPLLSAAAPTPPGAVNASFSLIDRGSERQVTANGSPLYTFSGDSGPGQTNGQGIQTFGGIWSAATAAGAPASTIPSAPTGAPTTGGYHY